ncbi:MAG: hypothetical protein ACK4G3_07845, partial [bacterium]
KKRITFPLRFKEYEEDYRYFYDPDLPLLLPASLPISLPELPVDKRKKWLNWGLSPGMVDILSSSVDSINFFEKCMEYLPQPKDVANWFSSDLLGLLDVVGGWENLRVTPQSFAELIQLWQKEEITGKAAKEILFEMAKKGGSASEWLERKGLKRSEDETLLERLVEESLEEGKAIVRDYLRGKKTASSALMGLIMKKSRGRFRPQKVQEVLMRKLNQLEVEKQ